MTFETFAEVAALESSLKVVPKEGPYGVNGRKATTSYVVAGEPGAEQVVVTLTTNHWKERKEFVSTLTWEVRSSDRGFAVSTWGSDHLMVRVFRVPVARYSAKALEAAHEVALATLEYQFEERGFGRVFEQAQARQGVGARD